MDTHFSAVTQQGQFQIDKKCMHYLNHIVQTCQANGIRLVFTRSPSLIIDKSNFVKEMQLYSQKKNVPYLSWNGDTTFTNHPELFYDMTHLNKEGAKIFTLLFLQRINSN